MRTRAAVAVAAVVALIVGVFAPAQADSQSQSWFTTRWHHTTLKHPGPIPDIHLAARMGWRPRPHRSGIRFEDLWVKGSGCNCLTRIYNVNITIHGKTVVFPNKADDGNPYNGFHVHEDLEWPEPARCTRWAVAGTVGEVVFKDQYFRIHGRLCR
jgi:hypothetical protein